MDKHKYEIYSEAAEKIQKRWIQGALKEDSGDFGVCALGGLGQSFKNKYYIDDRDIKSLNAFSDDLHEHLKHYPSYRIARARATVAGLDLSRYGSITLDAVAMWNDVPWRRKKNVVKLFRDLAEKYGGDFHENMHLHMAAEIDKLSGEIQFLKGEIQRLSARISELEQENGLLRRLANRHAISSDRNQLMELEQELSAKWDELQQVETHA